MLLVCVCVCMCVCVAGEGAGRNSKRSLPMLTAPCPLLGPTGTHAHHADPLLTSGAAGPRPSPEKSTGSWGMMATWRRSASSATPDVSRPSGGGDGGQGAEHFNMGPAGAMAQAGRQGGRQAGRQPAGRQAGGHAAGHSMARAAPPAAGKGSRCRCRSCHPAGRLHPGQCKDHSGAPIRIAPLVTGMRRNRVSISELLPEPVRPTTPQLTPPCSLHEEALSGQARCATRKLRCTAVAWGGQVGCIGGAAVAC